MAILFGAKVWKTANNESNLSQDIIGKNSVVFTAGDTVGFESGLMDLASTTDTVDGVVAKTVTMASDNQTVAKVQPEYYTVDESTEYLMGTNADLTGNATDVGTYYKLAGATGAIVVDVTSGAQTTTSRNVMIKKVDPRGIGGTGSGSGLRECSVIFVRKRTWIDQ